MGVTGTTAVWPPGMEPTVPAWSGRGRRPTRHPQARGVAADRMAGWRSTPDEVLVVDPAARHANRSAGLSCQAALADRARLYRAQTRDRPRSLRGTRWRGFHHHAAVCIATYGFLVAERAAIPPSAVGARGLVQAPSLPDGRPPHGATYSRSHGVRPHAGQISASRSSSGLRASRRCTPFQFSSKFKTSPERFRIRLTISDVPDEGGAFAWREEFEKGSDRGPEGVDGAFRGFSKQGFEL